MASVWGSLSPLAHLSSSTIPSSLPVTAASPSLPARTLRSSSSGPRLTRFLSSLSTPPPRPTPEKHGHASCLNAADYLVEIQFGYIFWTVYLVHTLNLVLKNICNLTPLKSSYTYDAVYEQCKWITNVYEDAMQAKNFIMNHALRLSMFNEFLV